MIYPLNPRGLTGEAVRLSCRLTFVLLAGNHGSHAR
jgi:hypothetical protein